MPRLAVITSHPVQYYAPLFRTLAKQIDLMVYYAYEPSATTQGKGFGVTFTWDQDLTTGYPHRFLTNTAPSPGAGGFSSSDTPDIHDRLRADDVDAALVLGWHLKSQLQGIVAAKRLGIPVIVRGDSQAGLQTSRVKNAAKTILYPWLLRRFTAACYVGERNKAYYTQYGYPEQRLYHSPHAVDTSFFTRQADKGKGTQWRRETLTSPQDRVVLFAGKLLPFKRPLDVVEAVAALPSRHGKVHLLVAGSGELETQMSELATARGVSYHPLGFVNQSDMPSVYGAADVLVLPSTGRETWGLVANEALASGTPVILSNACGSAPDLTHHGGGAARSFPLGNIAALTAALEAVLTHPPSEAAIAKVSAAHSLDAAAAGILKAVTATAGSPT
ncbi:Glycosyl transferase, group 1 [Parvularcula bermudensis HTCC2503]|uniref:Glycosyl transferase, group 1 n=1 Tax=Parvularcula bermudensis (strain ATCC BAA-594 / HTCC2503 / KCTC 12087) TaxID=314260 RepID=E0TC46_PARBH|nr:glycosyltransferase family 4 protein [Parvularcula bermudensis]ADM10304.1 Glycosyl transferase, group 1 [Parvularcula bermudensis HTCC2503]